MDYILFGFNYLLPLALLLTFGYSEFKASRLRKRCGEGITLKNDGFSFSGLQYFYPLLFVYVCAISLLWGLSFLGISDVVHQIYFKYIYWISFALLAFSQSVHVFVGAKGVLIGGKLIPYSQIQGIDIRIKEAANPLSPMFHKIVLRYTCSSALELKSAYVSRENLSILKEIFTEQNGIPTTMR